MMIDDARDKFMNIVYAELSDDSDNCRANRIIDAADEYAKEEYILRHKDETKRLEDLKKARQCLYIAIELMERG